MPYSHLAVMSILSQYSIRMRVMINPIVLTAVAIVKQRYAGQSTVVPIFRDYQM